MCLSRTAVLAAVLPLTMSGQVLWTCQKVAFRLGKPYGRISDTAEGEAVSI